MTVAAPLSPTLLCGWFLLAATVRAADEPPPSIVDREYLKGYVTDSAAVFTAPLRWNTKDWTIAGLMLGATAGVYALDDNMQRYAQGHRSETRDAISDVMRPFGSTPVMAGASVVLYGLARAARDEDLAGTALVGLEAVLVSALATEVVKRSFHRHRPESGAAKDAFDGPDYLSRDDTAFSSGHASTAFAMATVIACRYDDPSIVPVIAYGIAALTGLSRINDEKHWASDVVAGAAIGYFTARLVMHHHERRSRNANVGAAPLNGGVALTFSARF
jgi:membrane-associated phospholipid phosphatase